MTFNRKEYEKEWHKKNAKKCRGYRAKWRKNNPEKWKEINRNKSRRWARKNPEKSHAWNTRWKKANPEKAAVSTLRWRKANPEKVNTTCVKWQKANPEKKHAHEVVYKSKIPAIECVMCGCRVKANLHRHHPNYNKPLEVVILCGGKSGKCHYNEHKYAKKHGKLHSMRWWKQYAKKHKRVII